MIPAALNGKLPGFITSSEDFLTSAVFGFFKYSDRNIYLRNYLTTLGIQDSPDDVTFSFWESFPDGTEPDLILSSEQHIILIETKYHAGLGEGQAEREVTVGKSMAHQVSKNFLYVLVTSDPVYRSSKWLPAERAAGDKFRWQNWQLIERVISEAYAASLVNRALALDLLLMMRQLGLRSFLPFSQLVGHIDSAPTRPPLFFSWEEEEFSGFGRVSGYSALELRMLKLFFS